MEEDNSVIIFAISTVEKNYNKKQNIYFFQNSPNVSLSKFYPCLRF